MMVSDPESVALEAALRMFFDETNKQFDWLRDMFKTIDDNNFPMESEKIKDSIASMVSRKMEGYHEIWDEPTWIMTIHKRLLDASERAVERGETGDETGMYATVILVGWMEAFRKRFKELTEKLEGIENYGF